MNAQILDLALKNALIEIKKAHADLNWSFIVTEDGEIITSDDPADPRMLKMKEPFSNLVEKANVEGGLENMLIQGEHGKVCVSRINDMHFVAGLANNADLVYFRTITDAIFPTIIRIVDSIASSTSTLTPLKPPPFTSFSSPNPALTKSTPSEAELEDESTRVTDENTLEEETIDEPEELKTDELNESERPEAEKPDEILENVPSQQLIVDRFSGFMVKSDTVQLDSEVLKRWSTLLNIKEIAEVEIETFSGKSIRCKAKVINDPKLEGRGFIRIPEKTCQSLEVRRGELVRVKPVSNEEEESD